MRTAEPDDRRTMRRLALRIDRVLSESRLRPVYFDVVFAGGLVWHVWRFAYGTLEELWHDLPDEVRWARDKWRTRKDPPPKGSPAPRVIRSHRPPAVAYVPPKPRPLSDLPRVDGA
jgi:hypothetical protein